jgi:threonine dehydratase
MKPSADDILKAHQELSKYLHVTPIIESTSINELVGNGNKVYLKMEVM